MKEIDYSKRCAYETTDSERARNLRTALDGLEVDYCYGRFELTEGDLLLIHQFEFDGPAVAEAIAVQKLIEN